jgi:ribonuclease HI
MHTFEIYTDGACRNNPGPGGWGAVIKEGEQQYTLSGAELATTNNRMELLAVIKALNFIALGSKAIVTTDSKYVKDGITAWINNWKRNNWKAATGQPVKNQDLWVQLDNIVQQHMITWKWVKGHNGHIENELADQLARQAIDSLFVKGV